MKKSFYSIGALCALLGVGAILFVGHYRQDVASMRRCAEILGEGFRPVADTQAERFLGKVQPNTAECRGDEEVLAQQATPWVDWSNYWATGDASSRSDFDYFFLSRLGPNQRGIDGALLDLEYQRIELLKFNLFDNYTYPQYVRGRQGTSGRAIRVWNEMRLPPGHPSYTAVGGASEQVCAGDLIRHRTLSGICNDIRNPAMGATGQLFARNVAFESTFPELGANELARNRHGNRLGLLQPDPQVISRKLFTRPQSAPQSCNAGQGLPGMPLDAHCDYSKAPFFNVLAAYWIQFMTHDWFSHLNEGRNHSETMPAGCASQKVDGAEVPLSPEEAAELGCRPEDAVERAIIADSLPAPTFTHDGRERLARAPRTTRNTVTAWWDASQIYGHDDVSRRRVKRDPEDRAKLLMVRKDVDPQGYLPAFAPGDPINPQWAGQEATAFPDNWTIGLSFYHNVFAREHNLFVDAFRARAAETPDADSGLRDPADPDRVIRYRDVTDDELFEAGRLVVAAMIAKIHTIEWTPQLLYDEVMYEAMNANWHGLIREDNLLSRALEKVVVNGLGRSLDEDQATQWYSVLASGSGIFGLGSQRTTRTGGLFGLFGSREDAWDLTNPDHVNGGVNHFGSPFNFPEEFVTVYRLHPLVPDLLEYREVEDPNAITQKVPVIETFRAKATPAMAEGGLGDWGLTMGRQRLGALALQNHAQFLQNVEMPHLPSGAVDVAALDIIRDRERGVPRFNEFRRQYGLRQLTSFDDFVDQRLPEDSPVRQHQEALVEALREVYGQHVCDDTKVITDAQRNPDGSPITDCLGQPDGSVVDNVEDLDTVVGWLAESTRPHGFAISETQFQVFILNASRRLFSDRFFTSSFRPEFYTALGIQWVMTNGPDGRVMERESNGHRDEVAPLKRVLQRTVPELRDELDPVINTFDPWARDRGAYYSLAWLPRPGAESDPAFR